MMRRTTIAMLTATLCASAGVSAGAATETRTYLHRSRGRDLRPVEMTVTRNADGSLQYAVDDFPSGRHGIRVSLRVGTDGKPIEYLSASKEEEGYQWVLSFKEDHVELFRNMPDEPEETVAHPMGEDRLPDLNSRPDPYLAQHLLIQAYDFTRGGKQVFEVYDVDSTGNGLAEYQVSLELVDEDGVDLPNGRFKARHLLQVQESTASTWFKKRKGHRTDIWVNEKGVILRIYRHREPYELILQDYDRPDDLLETPEPAAAEPTVRIHENTIWCQATSARSNHPVARVLLPEGWAVTGGGGRANWDGGGSLLHASFPIRDGNREGWEVHAKDHVYPDQATLDVWAIGIRREDRNRVDMPRADKVLLAEATFEDSDSENYAVIDDEGIGGIKWSVVDGRGRFAGTTVNDTGKFKGQRVSVPVTNDVRQKIEVSGQFRIAGASGYHLVALWARTSSGPVRSPLLMFFEGRKGKGRYRVHARGTPHNSSVLISGDGSTEGSGDEEETFHTMSMVLDREAKRWSYYVDDKYLGTMQYEFEPGPITSVEMDFETPEDGASLDIRYDNLRAYGSGPHYAFAKNK